MPQSKRRGVRRGRRSAISRLSMAELLHELDRRQKVHDQLRAARDEVQNQLDAVEAELAGYTTTASRRGQPARTRRGTKTPRARRGRGGNKQSLATLLHSLLRGKTMRVSEMVEAAKRAGHKTRSKNFRTIVGLAIINNRKLFKRVARGQYTAKK